MSRKLQSRWTGPHTVKEIMKNKLNYKIDLGNSSDTVVHVSRLRKYRSRDDKDPALPALSEEDVKWYIADDTISPPISLIDDITASKTSAISSSISSTQHKASKSKTGNTVVELDVDDDKYLEETT